MIHNLERLIRRLLRCLGLLRPPRRRVPREWFYRLMDRGY